MDLIDATLAMLDDVFPQRGQVIRFLELAMEAGIMQFQISPSIYRLVEGKLPTLATFYMEISSLEEKEKYRFIQHFMMKKTIGKDLITVLQLNDLREMMQLRNFSASSGVMLVGMDDFLCYEYKHAFFEMEKLLRTSKLFFCPENSFHLAVATALMFARTGSESLVTTFTGIGNKAATEQVLMSLRLFKHYKVNQNLCALAKMKKLMEEITGMPIPDKMPIVGERIFWVESGIHVDGIMKNPANYELYPPELVGQKRTIVIGKHSGLNSIRIKMKELGFHEATEEQHRKILQTAKCESIHKSRSLTDEEFKQVVRKYA